MIDYLDAELSLKTVSLPKRLISGYAAVHHSVDRVRDIIDPAASAKAVARLGAPSDVGVFIGHRSDGLPMGIPQVIEATPQGLYTETYILKGSEGDNLLAKAKDLMDHGQSLGMSIGYKTHDSKMEHTAHGRVRRLLDYALKEYSYASAQAIAHPDALVSAVKSRRQAARRTDQEHKMQYRVEQQAGADRWSVLADTDADGDADDNRIIGTYPTADIANAVADALRRYSQDDDADGANDGAGANDDAAQQGAADKTATTAHASTSTGSTVHVNDLPNSSFLYVEDGDDDQEGRRVPRTKRHLPYRDAEGKLDRPNLEVALSHLGQDATGAGVGTLPGLDSSTKTQLAARARRLLEQERDGTTYAEAQEWKTGAPLSIYGLGIRLLDLAEQLCDEHKAMALLAEETKDGQRIRAPMRDHLGAVGKDLADLLRWAETIERGEDGRQRLAWFKQQLALTEV